MGVTGVSSTSAIGSISLNINRLIGLLLDSQANPSVAAFGTASGFGIQAFSNVDTGSNSSYSNVSTGSNSSYSDVATGSNTSYNDVEAA